MPRSPSSYAALTPYLVVKDTVAALDFYTRALGATELFRLTDMAGKVGHAEMEVAGAMFMLADELPEVMALEPTVRVPPMLAEAGRERGMMTPIAKTMASAEMRIGRRMAAIIGGAPSRRSHDVWA
jgi:hypothetical protein